MAFAVVSLFMVNKSSKQCIDSDNIHAESPRSPTSSESTLINYAENRVNEERERLFLCIVMALIIIKSTDERKTLLEKFPFLEPKKYKCYWKLVKLPTKEGTNGRNTEPSLTVIAKNFKDSIPIILNELQFEMSDVLIKELNVQLSGFPPFDKFMDISVIITSKIQKCSEYYFGITNNLEERYKGKLFTYIPDSKQSQWELIELWNSDDHHLIRFLEILFIMNYKEDCRNSNCQVGGKLGIITKLKNCIIPKKKFSFYLRVLKPI